MKYYIVRNLQDAPTLYWDGLRFQEHRSHGELYDKEDALQTIESECLQFAEIEPENAVHPVIQKVINKHLGI